MLVHLPFDALAKIGSYLDAHELGRVLLSCKGLYGHRGNVLLWQQIFAQYDEDSVRSLCQHLKLGVDGVSSLTVDECIEIARQLTDSSTLQRIRYHRPIYQTHRTRDGHETIVQNDVRLGRMEAHTMTTLGDRYLVVVGGWGQSREDEVDVIDGIGLPERIVMIPTETRRVPRFRYGFSSVAFGNSLYVYGGCRTGGYGGDCNDLYRIDLTFFPKDNSAPDGVKPIDETASNNISKAAAGHWERVNAVYSSNLTVRAPSATSASATSTRQTSTPYVPITRAYHSACINHVNGEGVMVLFGGLHESRPCNILEICRLNALQNSLLASAEAVSNTSIWSNPQHVDNNLVSGEEPSPRFGHSCLVATNGDMVITGGSNGTDLWRNGIEFHEIYVLRIERNLSTSGAAASQDRFVWSKLQFPLEMKLTIPGRCHAAVSLGNRMIYFGGSAKITDDLVVLNYQPENKSLAVSDNSSSSDDKDDMNGPIEYSSSTVYQPLIMPSRRRTTSPGGISRPCVRTSAAGARIGRYMCLFGGWNKIRRELGDLWVVDLATSGVSGVNGAAPRSALPTYTESSPLTRELFYNAMDTFQPDSGDIDDGEQQDEDHDDQDDEGHGGQQVNHDALAQVFQLMLTQGIDFLPALQMVQMMNGGAFQWNMGADDEDEEMDMNDDEGGDEDGDEDDENGDENESDVDEEAFDDDEEEDDMDLNAYEEIASDTD